MYILKRFLFKVTVSGTNLVPMGKVRLQSVNINGSKRALLSVKGGEKTAGFSTGCAYQLRTSLLKSVN